MSVDSSDRERPLALFVRMASRPIPRVSRMMAAARELGYDTVFVGATRDESLPRSDTWEGVRVERVGRPFPLVNGRRPFTYVRGVCSFWWGAAHFLVAMKPALVHASDVEAGIPAILVARLRGVPVVYNIHDNLAARYVLPRWIAFLLNSLEGLLVASASVTLVPEPFRRDLLPRWARARVRVVRNSPEDPGSHAPSTGPARPPRVLFAGWLDVGRGLREMLHLANQGVIHLVVAGDGDSQLQAELRGARNVEYLGFCSHADVIGLTIKCDYVAAFYDPARTINRYAASNKIAEALAVGRPVLTNVELEVASGLIAAGVAIAVPYACIRELGPDLDAWHTEPDRYTTAGRRAREHYERYYHSTQVRRASLDAFREAGVIAWS